MKLHSPWFGNALQCVSFESARASGKVTCVQGWRWDEGAPFTDFDIWYVLAGEGSMTLQERKYSVSRGSFLIIRPGDRPQAVQNDQNPLTILFVHFQIQFSNDQCLLPPRETKFDHRHDVEWMLHRLLEADERESEWSLTEFDGLMRLLFIQLFKRQGEEEAENINVHQAGLMKAVIRQVREVGGMTDLNQMAIMYSMSPQYLSRLFKRYSGTSFKEYIVRAKLERARSLLSESSLSVTEVANALQYADVYIFSKLFKKYFGSTPSQYRRSIRPAGTAPGTGRS